MTPPPRRTARTVALLATAALALGGALSACGDGDDAQPSGSSASVPASEPFNDADVAFATAMIPHHAQALAMVDMTRRRDVSPQLEELAQQVLEAQGPEIQTMTGWLQDWDQPVPATVRDHVNAEDHDGPDDMGMGSGSEGEDSEGTSEMPGMMSEQDLASLDSSGDADFEGRWLKMMIAHHEGAIEMARTEQSQGEYADATALADNIASDQAQEITRMEAMLEQ